MFVIVIVIALAIVAFTTWSRNKDVFSPVKIGLAYMVLYYKPVFSLECDFRLQVIYLGLVGILYVMACKEVPISDRNWGYAPNGTGASVLIWFTFPIFLMIALTIGAVAYMADDAQTVGGIRELTVASKLRVAGIAGLEGSYVRLFLFILLPYTSLGIYLLLFVTNRLSSIPWKILFFAHLLVVVAMGVLSLSRGSSLMPIASYLVLRNYCEKKVSITFAASVGGVLFLLALVMGVAREHFYFDSSGELNLGLEKERSGSSFSMISLEYGTLGLQALLDLGPDTLSLGSTFLSLLTHPIPRTIFPGKLESGGVFFTRYYLGDWGGTSYSTPTILGEFVMSFGWLAGLVLGYLFYYILWIYVLKLYRFTWIYKPINPLLFCILLFAYLRSILIATGLLLGEFTNVVLYDFYIVAPVLYFLWQRYRHLGLQRSFKEPSGLKMPARTRP